MEREVKNIIQVLVLVSVLVSTSGYADMVNVGGTLYRADQRFTFVYSDAAARGTLDAAGAARFLQQNPKMQKVAEGVWDYGGEVGAANLSVDTSQKFD